MTPDPILINAYVAAFVFGIYCCLMAFATYAWLTRPRIGVMDFVAVGFVWALPAAMLLGFLT
jgi:hypothetical protein